VKGIGSCYSHREEKTYSGGFEVQGFWLLSNATWELSLGEIKRSLEIALTED